MPALSAGLWTVTAQQYPSLKSTLHLRLCPSNRSNLRQVWLCSSRAAGWPMAPHQHLLLHRQRRRPPGQQQLQR
jgi:hypothetical protein